MKSISATWQVYIILCSDRSLYTGITKNIERRYRQHKEGKNAKYFRGWDPLDIVYLENGHTRSTAAKREAAIKALSRAEKTVLAGLAFKNLNTPAGNK